MTEFTLAAYIIAGTTTISGAFGSHDPSIKEYVLEKTAPIVSEFGSIERHEYVSDGLDRIIASKRIKKYHWYVALATEMLFASYGKRHEPGVATFVHFTDDYIAPVRALGLTSLAEALDVLAWGKEVRIPVPIDDWDEVTGQYYFDRQEVTFAFGEITGLGNIREGVNRLYEKQPDVFGELYPDDVEHLVESLSGMLSDAKAADAELAIFRNGGV